jgi:hypothetical protein
MYQVHVFYPSFSVLEDFLFHVVLSSSLQSCFIFVNMWVMLAVRTKLSVTDVCVYTVQCVWLLLDHCYHESNQSNFIIKMSLLYGCAGSQKGGGELSFPKVNLLQTPGSSSSSLTIEEGRASMSITLLKSCICI